MTGTMTTVPALRAFHGDPAVQGKYVGRVEAHRAADQIVQGTYWDRGRGCAIGCTIHGSDHFAYESELGIPAWLAMVEDRIFESLPLEKAKDWPLAFITAIPLGADLSNVLNQFMAWLMVDETWGVANITEDAEVKELCREVARRYLANETEGPDAAALTERLREAWAAREAWVARAAWAAWAAWEAWEAWAAWAAWEARQNFVLASSDEILRLLMEAPVPAEIAVAS